MSFIKRVTSHKPRLDYAKRLLQALEMPVPEDVEVLDSALCRTLPGVIDGENYGSLLYITPADGYLWWISSTSLIRNGETVKLAMLSPGDLFRLSEITLRELLETRDRTVGQGKPKKLSGIWAVELHIRLRDDELDHVQAANPGWHTGPIAAMMRAQTPESANAGPAGFVATKKEAE